MRAVPAQDPSDCSDPSNAATPSEVWSPTAFSRTRGATIVFLTCGIPSHRLRLRPQGFAPSRRFAPPMACRACFIPVPLLGLTLRGFQPLLAPCSFSDCQDPQGFNRRPLPHASRLPFTEVIGNRAAAAGTRPALLGFCSPEETDARVLGVSPGSRHPCLLGLFPSRLLAPHTAG
jgi:hypothetical protein